MATLTINGKSHDVDAEPDTPLLWVLRECRPHGNQIWLRCRTMRGMHRASRWGAPVLLVPGQRRGRQEHHHDRRPGSEQQAARRTAGVGRADVPQCGYCQSGMIMAVAALLKDKPKPTDADIDERHHQHLPVRDLQSRARGHSFRREGVRGAIMNYMPKIDRRAFSPALPPAPGSRSDATFRSAARRPRRRDAAGSERMGRGQARRHGRDPHRARRDGSGHAHRSRPARCRRT